MFAPISAGAYNIHVGRGLLQEVPGRIISLKQAAVYVILSDSNVSPLYGEGLYKAFEKAHCRALLYEVPAGEQSKSRAVKAEVEDWMLANGCNRDTVLVALGGGVVGDLGGFIAATYMRGIPFVQCPTSILAMVDSSIGGKTGIDTVAGKNLVGAFHKPLAVFADLECLTTLPIRELCNGMGETIKTGAIQSLHLFELCENSTSQVLGYDLTVLGQIVHASATIKAGVVIADFEEADFRSILNFGHTIGHAIEAYMQPDLLHGECIAIGMIEECELARRLGYLTDASASQRLAACLRAYRLPTSVPRQLAAADLVRKMLVDKKNKGGQIKVTMLKAVGEVCVNPATYSVEHADFHNLFQRHTATAAKL